MKKCILFLFLLIAGILDVNAQETFTYANPDRDFFDGKDFFVQRKFSASLASFERFVKQRDAKAEPYLLQEAAYYIACDAYELRKETAQGLLQNYLQKYPYTQFEDKVCYMLGNLAFEGKQYDLALKYYTRADEKHLTKTEATEITFNTGYSYLQTNDYAKAKPLFKNLKGKKSKYESSASYYYSYTEYSMKNYDAALDGFLAIEGQPEYSGFVPYYIIQIYYFQKQYDKLMPYADKVIAQNPSSPNNTEVYRILGECAYQKNDYKNAISYLTKYLKGAPKAIRNDMYILGVSYYKTQDYENAAKYLAKVTTAKDSLAQNAYLHLGNSYVQLGNKNNARMAFRTASEMNFDKNIKEEAAYNYTLSTFETTTPFGESIKAFESFLKDYPDSKYRDNVYENLVTAYMSSKNYAAASASLEKLKLLSPAMKDVKAYIQFQLGTEEFVKGNYDKAIELFHKSIDEATPQFKSAQVYYWLGESNYRLGKYDEARKAYNEFLDQKGSAEFPDYNMVNYGLGYTHFQQKQYKEAVQPFLKYVNNEKNNTLPSYTDALNRLGDCYFIARDLINAEKCYTQSMSKGGKDADYASFQRAIVQGLRKNYNGKVKGMLRLINDYSRSSYVDDAYYELARAYVLLEDQEKAVETYRTLIEKFPQSPLARKAAVEIGMLYYNAGKDDEAIEAYKTVVSTYPNSEETKTALESMEAIYVEKNKVDSYFDYTRSLGKDIVVTDASKEDSLTYLAAEKLYMKSNFEAAASAFDKYIQRFCPGSRSCISARYYLADCYYSTNKMDNAIEQYKALAQLQGNQYMEKVLVRLSQIAYDKKDYQLALESFKQLAVIAQEHENVNAAKIGILRCSYLLNDVTNTVASAKEILANKQIDPDLAREARFHLAKAYIQTGEPDKAQTDLQLLAKDLRTSMGAEAKYLLADYYFTSGNDKKAEEEINDYINKGTPYQYWLARSFVLLADIYIKRGDDFQAKQYLMSLQANYTAKDSIQDLIQERMDGIQSRESNTISN
ncbi:MAG: tetratricopeptide repeat protein [Paludibacteraceae bacterium]|nr:tetratricopeptide repeat protein [Paludibacteraceae bacterium]